MERSMNLTDIESKLKADRSLHEAVERALKSASPELLEGGLNAFTTCFRELTRIDHSGRHAEAAQLEAACFEIGAVMLRHIDQCGITAALGRGAGLVRDFSFVQNRSSMVFDHMLLVERMAIPTGKVDSFWRMADERRAQALDMMGAPDFRFESLLHRKRKTAEQVPEWAHLMRPWVLLGGIGLGAGNIAAAVFSAGVATPLLFASGATAVIGIADGVYDK
jgi:hypothetical protein